MGATNLKRSDAAPLPECDTFVELLRARAERQPDDTALVFLRDGEQDAQTWSYAELAHRVSTIASALERCEGERVLLLYEAGLEYVAAFLGALTAGAVAVPAYPPVGRRPLDRVNGIVSDCGPKLVLSTAHLRDGHESRTQSSGAAWLCTDEIDADVASFRGANVRPADLAMLQYTSGSTGAPKGVMVSHANMMANCAAIHAWLGPDPRRVGSIWLPPFHDMGLLGGILHPLYEGFPLVFMTPMHFVQRPVRWLRAISDYGVTLSGGPNFAYAWCVDRVSDEDLADLDLRSWRDAFCGAEPVVASTLQSFASRFAQTGFEAEAFNPCYGMAEATLLVSGKPQLASAKLWPASEGGPTSLQVDHELGKVRVSCGAPAEGTRVEIVDVHTRRPVADGEEGEVWVRSASVCEGYWEKPDATTDTFGAHLEDGSGPFLRTGDMGAMREGELYISGRLKAVVIVAGRNLYAEDVERAVQDELADLRPGPAAAFGVEGPSGESLVVAVELPRLRTGLVASAGEITQRVRGAVTRAFDVSPSDVALCRSGSIPRTTSGKVQRAACREAYLEGAFSSPKPQQPQVEAR